MHRRNDVRGVGRCSGITLAELLIVVAILGILAALAWPGYTDMLRKGRRLDAVAGLYRVQLEQERYRSSHHRYAERLSDLGWSADETDSDERFYRIRLEAVDDPRLGFRAIARPRSGSDQVHDACGEFALTHEGPEPQGAHCWPG